MQETSQASAPLTARMLSPTLAKAWGAQVFPSTIGHVSCGGQDTPQGRSGLRDPPLRGRAMGRLGQTQQREGRGHCTCRDKYSCCLGWDLTGWWGPWPAFLPLLPVAQLRVDSP